MGKEFYNICYVCKLPVKGVDKFIEYGTGKTKWFAIRHKKCTPTKEQENPQKGNRNL